MICVGGGRDLNLNLATGFGLIDLCSRGSDHRLGFVQA